jgi:hypothetical protein
MLQLGIEFSINPLSSESIELVSSCSRAELVLGVPGGRLFRDLLSFR